MGSWQRVVGAGLVLALPPSRLRAECLGSCMDNMVADLASILVYGLIGIVLLVMLIRAKWRRAGLWTAAIVASLALVPPLASQIWVAWKLARMEAREVLGVPPTMTGRVPLLITPDRNCQYSSCEAVLAGREAAGILVLAPDALAGLDPARPVDLAGLPLEHWFDPDAVPGQEARRSLSATERRVAAAGIDYLIVTNWAYHLSDPGPVEAGLRDNPALRQMGGSESVRLLLAPLPEKGFLSFAGLQPDLLDLTLLDRPLALPFAPLNRKPAANVAIGTDVAVRAICPGSEGYELETCRSLLER